MDAEAFDRLSRTVATASRRGVLLAGVGGALATFSPVAARSKKKKPKPKACAKAGAACSTKVTCCRGAGDCLDQQCVCQTGQQRRCDGTCIPISGCCDDGDCRFRGHDDPCSVLRCRNHDCLPVAAAEGSLCGAHSEGTCRAGTCQPRACTRDEECDVVPTDPDCGSAACRDHECVVVPQVSGIPVPPARQTAGDCLTHVCDGTGGVIGAKNDADPPPNAGPCLVGACDAGAPEQRPRPSGHPCPGGHCDGAGRCLAG